MTALLYVCIVLALVVGTYVLTMYIIAHRGRYE